jgi:LysM domain
MEEARMSGTRYVVQKGDTLSGLAQRFLGGPNRWPMLFEHNNSPAITALTKTKIVDPDLIFIGQVLYIPQSGDAEGSSSSSVSSPPLPVARPSPPGAKPVAPSVPARPALRQVRGIPFKYSLDLLPPITLHSPVHVATIKLSGSVTLQPEKAVDFAELTKDGFELKAKRESDLGFAKLVGETSVGFNPMTKQISFENGITTHSNVPYAPTTSASVGVSSLTGLPSYKTTIQAPEIKGRIEGFFYVTSRWKVEIEITPKPPTAVPRPVPVPARRPQPVRSPSKWEYLAAAGLIAGAGVLIVATVVEDIVTLGAGLADDVPSFAAASAMFVGGVTVFKSVQGPEATRIEGVGKVPSTF